MVVETIGLGMLASFFLTETVGLAAGGMAKETEDFDEVEFYTPKELRDMLDTASGKPWRRSRNR